MSDGSIEVSVEDILREMDAQTRVGWDLAHQKAVNRVLMRKLAQYENDKVDGES